MEQVFICAKQRLFRVKFEDDVSDGTLGPM